MNIETLFKAQRINENIVCLEQHIEKVFNYPTKDMLTRITLTNVNASYRDVNLFAEWLDIDEIISEYLKKCNDRLDQLKKDLENV